MNGRKGRNNIKIKRRKERPNTEARKYKKGYTYKRKIK